MAGTLSYYIQILSCAGFFVLTTLSIMAFCNVQALNINEGKNVHSGIILLVTAIIYGIIAGVLFYRDGKKSEIPHRNIESSLSPLQPTEYSANSNEKLYDSN